MTKSKNQKTLRKKQILFAISATVAALVLIIGTVIYAQYQAYQLNLEHHGANAIRQTLVQAIDELTEPAVRDARSGDYYFPEAKLVLPIRSEISGIKYSYDYDSADQIRITTQQITATAKSKLYGAYSTERVFDALPEYQACERGILLSFSPIADDSGAELIADWQKRLSDGRTLLAYTEDACPAQADQLDMLKAIDSY